MKKSLDQLLAEAGVRIEENIHGVLEYGKLNMYGMCPEDFCTIRHYSIGGSVLDYDTAYSDYNVFKNGETIMSCVGADEVDEYIQSIISEYTGTDNCVKGHHVKTDEEKTDRAYLVKIKNLIIAQLSKGTSSIDDSAVERTLSCDSIDTEEFSLVFNADNTCSSEDPICRFEYSNYAQRENEYVIDLYIDSYLYEKDQIETIELYIYKALADELVKIEQKLADIEG